MNATSAKLLVILTAALTGGLAEQARADEIVLGDRVMASYTFVESLSSFNLSIVGRPVDRSGQVPLNLGDIWRLQLLLIFRDHDTVDVVVLQGTGQHLVPPDDAATHEVAGSAMLNILWAGDSGEAIEHEEQTPDHLPHKDTYRQRATYVSDGDDQLLTWTAVITGRHVPEPSSLALLALGGLGAVQRRRRPS